jgi:hypothetical protein
MILPGARKDIRTMSADEIALMVEALREKTARKRALARIEAETQS